MTEQRYMKTCVESTNEATLHGRGKGWYKNGLCVVWKTTKRIGFEFLDCIEISVKVIVATQAFPENFIFNG